MATLSASGVAEDGMKLKNAAQFVRESVEQTLTRTSTGCVCGRTTRRNV